MVKAVMLSVPNNGSLARVFTPPVMEQLRAHYDYFDTPIGPHNADEHAQALSLAEVAFCTWGMAQFTAEQIKAWMPRLKAVFYAAGSVQYFAEPFLQAGVRVFSAWGANAVPVAQVTAAQIILANKGFFQNAAACRKGYQEGRKISGTFPGNYSVKVGLLGAGMIGRMVIANLQKLMERPGDFEILVFDPYLSEESATKLGVRKASLAEVFESCQTVSNHLANKEEIAHIVNYDVLRLMPDNGTFINTGRGRQVSEADLYRALSEQPGRAAVLDVTDPEPPDVAANPLFQLPNVYLTPHTAGSITKECARQALFMLDECAALCAGEPVRFEVSLAMLSTMA